MNRKPQPADSWWSTHQATCNGTFEKISGEVKKESATVIEPVNKFKGKGRTWSNLQDSTSTKVTEFFKKKPSASEVPQEPFKCVNCTDFETKSLLELNEHLDICLTLPKKKFTINLADEEDSL